MGGFRIGRGCRGRSKVVVEGGIGMEEEEEEEESMVDDIVVVVAVDAEVEGQSSRVRHSFRQFRFFFVYLF